MATARRCSQGTWRDYRAYKESTTDVVTLGDVDSQSEDTQIVRIIHVSDTHLQHADFAHRIPGGDILVHSGDFHKFRWTQWVRSRHYEDLLHEMDTFYGRLPHRHKIFVAGNHDKMLDGVKESDIQNRLNAVTYLKDESVVLNSITFYGAPWTATRFLTCARGFARPWDKIARYWGRIPNDIDVLVTHMPPRGILDLARKKQGLVFRLADMFNRSCECEECGVHHEESQHWGCPALRDAVLQRVRPKLHLFGHVHESYGVYVEDKTVFSNAAIPLGKKANVFDYYISAETLSIKSDGIN